MSIAETYDDIEDLAEEIRAENDRRYAFYRMLNATDRVLGCLEELNLKGVKSLPAAVGAQIRPALSELPLSCLEPLVGGTVQEVLDSVFEVQERLLRWRDPARDVDADDEEGPDDPVLDARIVAELARHPGGLHSQVLAERFMQAEHTAVRRRARILAAAGAIGCEIGTSANGKETRRYFAVGEGSGG